MFCPPPDSDIGASEDTLALLDRSIAQAQHSYELVGHDPAEAALYAQFKDKWRDYRGIAGEVLALSHSGRHGGSNHHVSHPVAIRL